MNAGTTMEDGERAPCTARMLIAVVGTNCRLAVFTARKVTIELLATVGRGLSFCKRAIARRPSGVAALLRPSIFADMFNTIAPIAGCSGGTSGNSRRITGFSARASTCTSPARSARRIIPIQIAISPTSGSAIFITASSA